VLTMGYLRIIPKETLLFLSKTLATRWGQTPFFSLSLSLSHETEKKKKNIYV
jgi:hypothetical protein